MLHVADTQGHQQHQKTAEVATAASAEEPEVLFGVWGALRPLTSRCLTGTSALKKFLHIKLLQATGDALKNGSDVSVMTMLTRLRVLL